MFVSRVYFGKTYNYLQYLSTLLLLIGLVLFSLADAAVSLSYNPKGLIYMCASVMIEALGQNLQEKAVTKHKCTEREVVNNIYIITNL